MAAHSVRTIENCGLNFPLRIRAPHIELSLVNPHQSAGHVQPERMGVVLHDPVDGIAGQAVPTSERGHTTAFHSAEPACCRGPERTVTIESKIVDRALAESVGDFVRCPDLAV